MVYVNGEPRAGDPYRYGYVHLPVLMRAGTNDFLFHVARGRFQARLIPPKAEAAFDVADMTLPDLISGEEVKTWGALLIINSSLQPQTNLEIHATIPGAATAITKVRPLLPLSIRKVGFKLESTALVKEGNLAMDLKLVTKLDNTLQILNSASLTVAVRRPEHTHKQTFLSDIDGSVQYYAVVPPRAPEAPERGEETARPGLVLTLHGAAVEASGQAACYAPKMGVYVVAPTNRRPFGFDWEDWGRWDALEVLELTQKRYHVDPRRVYLTGHSMGGHGTWHIGATFPDRFAAIGPSAGWISMWSYAGARRPDNPDRMAEMLLRAASPSDTLALLRNYSMEGVYVLHGDKDDNVPVAQARTMKQSLFGLHPDFVYHEQAGAGHWWGNACVDWPPMFEFFSRHRLPERKNIHQVEFTTASPGVSARCHWAMIDAQLQQLQPSSVKLRFDPDIRRLTGTTDNVARLAINRSHVNATEPVEVELDGQELGKVAYTKDWRENRTHDKDQLLWFQREQGKWKLAFRPSAGVKGPHRCGPFKEAFRNRMVYVYGTVGSPEENAWALAKARYDAEVFWYRGNGSVDIVADIGFDASADRDRNVILYGNADSNAAWKALLADNPVQLRRGIVRVGERTVAGEDLGCLFVRPRPGSDQALVGVVTGTGVAGMRVTDRLPYFVSGVGYPDCIVISPSVLARGTKGVRVAGYFGVDWSVSGGQCEWLD
jgi:poly(3-hydroxybutyrate) depolymerase